MSDKTTLVLYHDNCLDGFTAAWAVWKVLGDSSTEYRGVSYGQPTPDCADRNVKLVDFCYPRAEMDKIAATAKSVFVYDHHKSAMEDMAGWNGGHTVFDMNRSGAAIAWDSWHGKIRPMIVEHVQDRDLWRFGYKTTRAVCEYLMSLDREFQVWSAHASVFDFPHQIIQYGEVLLKAKARRVEDVVKFRRWGLIGGYFVPIVNVTSDTSDAGERLLELEPGCAFAAYYFDRDDKRQWGLRSHGDFDVSKVAAALGGGGHRNAAGFQTEIE